MYKIDQRPEAPCNSITSKRDKYPFGYMQVGESFFVADRPFDLVRRAAYMYSKRHDFAMKYKPVLATRDDVKGIVVWRTM